MISSFEKVDSIQFPEFRGIRALMMPIVLDDLRAALPEDMQPWRDVIKTMAAGRSGIGYLTIDEMEVGAGQRHRRPGLHVDGWSDDSDTGIWGGGGGWGSCGFLMAANISGCAAWAQEITGEPKRYGDCEHLRAELNPDKRTILSPLTIYSMGSLCIHETLPMQSESRRQFIRLSLPSNAAWPSSNTPNPKGIRPTGGIDSPRPRQFTEYKPQ